MPVRFHRGPLPPGFTASRFCAPDADVPWQASGLSVPPRLLPIAPCDLLCYLEGHRAPDVVLAQLEALGCDVVVQGDPLASRPRDCSLMASELLKCADPPWFAPSMTYFRTIEECIDAAQGEWRMLAGSRESCNMVREKLRGHADMVYAGDPVLDWRTHRRAKVVRPAKVMLNRGTAVHLDDGRIVRASDLYSRVAETLYSFGSGECDTLIILPDVPDVIGRMAVRRVKHQVIGLGWHPALYLGT